MVANRAQHFVPQFLLRNFAADLEKRQICIFNIKRGKVIERASLRDQCRRNYFYGRDLTKEHALGQLEAEMDRVFKLLLSGPSRSIQPVDRPTLYFFMGVQWGRTDVARKHADDLADGIAKATLRGKLDRKLLDQVRITDVHAVEQSLAMGVKGAALFFDLALVLLHNRTGRAFITSDNPLVLTNPFAHGVTGLRGYGVASAGLIMLLAVSGTHALLAFDSNVFVSNAPDGARLELTRASDIDAINRMTAMGAGENLYFGRAADGERVAAYVSAAEPQRRRQLARVRSLVPGPRAGSYVEPRSEAELDAAKEILVQTSNEGLTVPLVIRGLRRRIKPRYFWDGSALGPTRDPAWGAIVEDFWSAHDAAPGQLQIGDLFRYAPGHPLFDQVGAWWTTRFASASGQ
jgi:hypothetical protein